ncbi:MAG: hypothetical protein A4E23_01448 [Methanomethylovorans sp. PtaU1.Bin073]|nr:MAG: hypothetical protein A4E23_01448 [Methanomethylovorans sp. PtaU1.Bin073]
MQYLNFYIPLCKKECVFEWVIFRNSERTISQRCPIYGHLRLAPMVPTYIERIKSESLLKYISTDAPAKCKGCSKLEVCKQIEQGFVDICEYKQ